MEKKKIEINIKDFPKELHDFLKDAEIYDSSCGADAKVLYSDLGYYIKIAANGKLQQEASMARLFAYKGMGAEVVAYISQEKDYMVTKSIEGEDALYDAYLENPIKLCEMLADAMKYLHSREITDVPVSPAMDMYDSLGKGEYLKRDTFIHGDFCLPNVMFKDGKFMSFVDVGAGGVGDKHIDIYWVLWSLQFNLGTDEYRDYFLDLYGREKIDSEILKIVTEVEEKALEDFMKETFAKPAVGAIITKRVGDEEYILVQDRAKNNGDGADGQLEIPAGKIREYENIFEALRREVWEETGLHITSIRGEEESTFLDVKGSQTIIFSPYCVTQNLSGAYSLILSTFLCEAEGELLEKTNETKNIRWMKKEELKQIVDNSPEKIFLMHVNALRKYLG